MDCISEETARTFVERLLSAEEEARVQEHIDVCPSCRQRLAAAARRGASSHDSLAPSETQDWSAPGVSSDLSRWSELEPGARIGRYVLIYRVGAGSMGVVYAAYDPKLDRKVALKLLRSPRGLSREQAKDRFLREAQALARLAHPNVVSVFDAGWVDDHGYIAMELVDGGSLREWLRREPRSWRAVVHMFRQAGAGLAASHAAGLVHRDFKPDNVLVGKDGRARVSDFGLARLVADADADGVRVAPGGGADTTTSLPSPTEPNSKPGTIAGALVGTPSYMSPEQLRGEPADALSDQFSFSAALFEALCGKRPFAAATPAALVAAIESRALSTPQPGVVVPRWLLRVLERGLAAQPGARYASLSELLEALRRDPAVRARKLALVAGLLVVMAGAIPGYRHWLRAAPSPCRDLNEALSELWSPPVSEEVRNALLASGQAGSGEAFVRVDAALSRFRQEWAQEYKQACAAVTGESSRASFSPPREQLACLEQQHSEALGLQELLLRPDADLQNEVSRRASGLAPPRVCATAGLTKTRQAAPERGSPGRAEYDRITRELGVARALLVTGRYEEAVLAVDPLLLAARQFGFTALEMELRYTLGSAQMQLAHADEARNTLRETALAAERSLLDRVAARAYLRLARLEARQGAPGPTAALWLDQAEAASARLGADRQLQGVLEAARASVLEKAAATWPEALAHARQGFELLDGLLPETNPDFMNALEVLANSLGHLRPIAEVIPVYARVLDCRRRAYGDRHPAVAAAALNLGRAYEQAGDNDEALHAYEEAVEIYSAKLGRMHPRRVMAVARLSHLRGQLGHCQDAIPPLIEAALSAKSEPRENNRGAIELMLEDTYRTCGQIALALGVLERIRTRDLGPDEAAEVEVELGLLSLQQGRREDARAALQRGAAASEQRLDQEGMPVLLALAHFGLAQIDWQTGRRDAVLDAKDACAVIQKQSELTPGDFARHVEACEAWLAARGVATSEGEQRPEKKADAQPGTARGRNQ